MYLLPEDQLSVKIIQGEETVFSTKFEKKNADLLLAFGISCPAISPGTIQSHTKRFNSHELCKNDKRQEAKRKCYQRDRGNFAAKLPD